MNNLDIILHGHKKNVLVILNWNVCSVGILLFNIIFIVTCDFLWTTNILKYIKVLSNL